MSSSEENDPATVQFDSPSLETSPLAALSTSPTQERSASRASFTSSSSVSTQGNQDGTVSKKRGYMRPQATVFADSARNRESVMSLGSIAHLQYYFARTGLLDGKGAQLARDTKRVDAEGNPIPLGPSNEPSVISDSLYLSELHPSSPSNVDFSDYDSSLVTSTDPSSIPSSNEDPHTMMTLPPTVSTYKHRQYYVPPPPDLSVLRRELKEAMDDAKKVLVELQENGQLPDTPQKKPVSAESGNTPDLGKPADQQGWHEVQGLHVLDLVTLAIRAAKNYYTCHERPQRLYSIRSERSIRAELYAVLEVLKKVAARNFVGGYRKSEVVKLMQWIASIEELVAREETAEKDEHSRRESWSWLRGDWAGHERQREWQFLQSFQAEGSNPIPNPNEGPPPDDDESAGEASEFCQYFQNGIELVKLHNRLVDESRRHFGKIKEYHTDMGKPYRLMENLRFWVKAAELRWDLFLQVDVEGVVLGKDDAKPWKSFDTAIMTWSRHVREEITSEWNEQREAQQFQPPILRI